MAEQVKLKVTFDDSEAQAGFDRVGRAGESANRRQGGPGGGSSAVPAGDGLAGGSAKGFGALLAQEIGQQVAPALRAALEPLKTSRQREEAGFQAAAPIIGTAVGAAVGSAIPGIGTVVGAAIGSQLGTLAGELSKLIDPEGRAVNESVSNVLQQEAATRARLGVPIRDDELRAIGTAEARGASAEFAARKQAIGVTNQVAPGFFDSILGTLGLVRGKQADQGPAVYRDALAQATEDRW